MCKLIRVLKYVVFFVVIATFPQLSEADQPERWQLGFQKPATPVMEHIADFHDLINAIMFSVAGFVLSVLIYVLIRFSKKNNPIPSKNSHNTLIEVVWTIIPLIIVGFIAIPSIKLLSYEEKIPEPEMTVKVVGYQWYWSYEYVDHEDVSFDSNIRYDLEPGELRLFEVDNRLVVPVNTNIKIQVTGADVIHSWAVPAFGVKKDAIPGRLNETWVNIKDEGVYYGQCSELCGILHGFMPIVVEAMNKKDFNEWLESAKEQFL